MHMLISVNPNFPSYVAQFTELLPVRQPVIPRTSRLRPMTVAFANVGRDNIKRRRNAKPSQHRKPALGDIAKTVVKRQTNLLGRRPGQRVSDGSKCVPASLERPHLIFENLRRNK